MNRSGLNRMRLNDLSPVCSKVRKPAKLVKKLVLMTNLVTCFESSNKVTKQEVNDVLDSY